MTDTLTGDSPTAGEMLADVRFLDTRITPNGHVEVVTVTAEKGVHREVIEPGDVERLRAVLSAEAADAIVADPAFSDPANRLVPQPAVVVVPVIVSRLQFRAILRRKRGRSPDRTLFDDAEELATTQGGDARDAWEDAGEFRRDSPLLNAMAHVLGVADQLDELFIEMGRFQP